MNRRKFLHSSAAAQRWPSKSVKKTADKAKAMHLIDRLVDAGDALQATRDLAQQIAANSQWSTRATKQMIRGLQNGWHDTHPDASALARQGFTNQDFQDGFRAFLEKRPPNFTFK